MKFVVLFAVLLIAYMVWRNNRRRDERDEQARSGRGPAAPQEMVSCPVCGVHLPRGDAVPGARGVLYCSHEHRQRAGG